MKPGEASLGVSQNKSAMGHRVPEIRGTCLAVATRRVLVVVSSGLNWGDPI